MAMTDKLPPAQFGVSRWIRVHALMRPDDTAIVCANVSARHGVRGRASFAELEGLTEKTAGGLRALGLGPGDRVVLMVEPGVAFFALAFGLFRIGAVMIGVDPGMGISRVRNALALGDAVAFVGNTKAVAARALFRWGEETVRNVVMVGGRVTQASLAKLARTRGLTASSMTFEALLELGSKREGDTGTAAELEQDASAAILFTSGSTGAPKGVLYSHRRFEAQLAALRNAYSITPGERELATFPLFALFAPALGMRAVIPSMDFTKPGAADPDHLMGLIEREGVTSMFGSPALLKRLAMAARVREPRLSTVERVVSAGAPVPYATLVALSTAFSERTSLHTPYGATEALPVASIEATEILGEARQGANLGSRGGGEGGGGVCVGRPCDGMEVRIVSISDAVLLADCLDDAPRIGEIGEIVVRGPVVTRSYVGDPKANELAKIETDDGFFHRMGDLGYLDHNGRLWFCGRKSERVPLPGGDLYTIPCEALFNLHQAVARSALVGVRRGATVIPVIIVELNPRTASEPPWDLPRVQRELMAVARESERTADIRHVLFHPEFPVDPRHNAKISRAVLAAWATKRLR